MFGWNPDEDVRLLTFAACFDIGLRCVAQLVENREYERLRDNGSGGRVGKRPSREVYDDWNRTASPDAMAALRRMSG